MHARPLSRPAATKLRLEEIVAHPDLVSTLPEETLAPLLAAVAAQQTAEEVAQFLGVTHRWVQRRARRLPFARQLSEHAIRYSEPGLKRWMAHRRAEVA